MINLDSKKYHTFEKYVSILKIKQTLNLKSKKFVFSSKEKHLYYYLIKSKLLKPFTSINEIFFKQRNSIKSLLFFSPLLISHIIFNMRSTPGDLRRASRRNLKFKLYGMLFNSGCLSFPLMSYINFLEILVLTFKKYCLNFKKNKEFKKIFIDFSIFKFFNRYNNFLTSFLYKKIILFFLSTYESFLKLKFPKESKKRYRGKEKALPLHIIRNQRIYDLIWRATFFNLDTINNISPIFSALKKKLNYEDKNTDDVAYDTEDTPEIIALYKQLIARMLKKGNKVFARRFLSQALAKAVRSSDVPISGLLAELYEKLRSGVQVRILARGKKEFIVPSPANFKKRVFIMSDWLITAAIEEKKRHGNLGSRLGREMKTILDNYSKSVAMRYKINIADQAVKNLSNKHFRW